MRVLFTAAAQEDLRAIGDYIAQDNPQRAVSFIAEMEEACRSLSLHPQRFPIVPRFGDKAVRKRVFGRYLIFYRIGPNAIEILHVLHGATDVDALL